MTATEKPDLTGILVVGSPVVYVDPVGRQHAALVTAIRGEPKDCPLINLVYVNHDGSSTDSYGRQIARQTSLHHRTAYAVHGQYYMMPNEETNPTVHPTQS